MRIIFQLALNDVKKTFKTPKIYLIILMTVFFILEVASGINIVAEAEGIGIPPFLYPLFVSNWSGSLYTILLIIVLMSDAPYECGAELYIRLRIKKEYWYFGKVIYIIMMSFIYQMIMIVISILGIIKNITLSRQWGEALENYWQSINSGITIAGEGKMGDILDMPPIKVMGMQLFIAVLVSILIGCVIFIINTALQNFSGTIIVGIFSCLHLYLSDLEFFRLINKLQGYVPVSWINLQNDFMVFSYITEVVILSVFIVIFSMIGLCMVKKGILRLTDDK